jgi:hypothetical protein
LPLKQVAAYVILRNNPRIPCGESLLRAQT